MMNHQKLSRHYDQNSEFSFLYNQSIFISDYDEEEENFTQEEKNRFTPIPTQRIIQKLLSRLLDLRNVTFFRNNFSVALIPYTSEFVNGENSGDDVFVDHSIDSEYRVKTPRMEVADNCLLNLEQVFFKTFTSNSKTVSSILYVRVYVTNYM
jgi:hypothetical protein